MKPTLSKHFYFTAACLAFMFAVSLLLPSCEGLTISVNPDGSVGGSYSPPPKPVAPTK